MARFLLEGAAGSTYSRKQTHLRGFKAFGIFLLFGAGVAFLVLGAVLVMAARGWFLRRFWGWGLAVVLVGTQSVASAVNAILGDFRQGAAGSILAGAILCFLLRPQVRTAFRRKAFPDHRIG